MKFKLILAIFIIAITGTSLPADKGQTVQDFILRDTDNKEYSLTHFSHAKAIVLVFVSTRCPWSNAYNERLIKLVNNYKDKNVQFLAINSNQLESVEEIKTHSIENNLNLPVLKDTDNRVADQLQASVTPEVYVIGKNYKILYHGRIDDSRDETQVKSKDLENALQAILAGKEVTINTTKAFGCSIKRSN
ncbi:MAG TPA: thioredoxin family protein [bacterium]|nr:thioredoxin family protein [bacterium]HPN43462.1 thioredoxin family protein [bacterium]